MFLLVIHHFQKFFKKYLENNRTRHKLRAASFANDCYPNER